MTIDELTTLLTRASHTVPGHLEVPENLNDLLRQIAEWMHIDQKGFAASDIRHMILEMEVLSATLQRARLGLLDVLDTVKDTE